VSWWSLLIIAVTFTGDLILLAYAWATRHQP
jgi:hypothetical protein